METEITITRREILFSLTILAIMVGFGVWISSSMLSSSSERYLDKVSCVSVTDASEFDYIGMTGAGRFVAEGTLSAIDVVGLPELPRQYSFIRKVKEEYRCHTETYTTTDSKGKTTTHTREYYSWDEVEHWDYAAENVKFLGKKFKAKNVFPFEHHTRRDTIIKVDRGWFEPKTRFVYYTCPVSHKGIITGVAEDNKYKEMRFQEGKTIQWYFQDAESELNTCPFGFWTLWLILTAVIIAGFYSLENEWLY